MNEHIYEKLVKLYGAEQAPSVAARLFELIGSPSNSSPRETLSLSERDIILITYGDQVHQPGVAPLKTLHTLLEKTIQGHINTVHILPFYPFTSDDGFSVIDFYEVNPALGSWEDIQRFHQDFRLMFDAVFNHISSQSAWFQAFLRGEVPYDKYFITVDPSTDLSLVRRPRALPLLTPFQTADREKHVWTTFSDDQIDLNVANPDVLLELIRALLFYVWQGADLIRLDAIAYLWKRIGTTSIHLEETHLVVQLMRDVLDIVAPSVLLITETNVPHEENISYFGDGTNQAQMVYQFSLPPLIVHTFRTGDATKLTQWSKTVKRVSNQTTFFNFTASHDGIGVTPARGILSDDEIEALLQLVEEHGGYVSYKTNSDGTRSPYELNISYFDAITHPTTTAQDPITACNRFICSQAIMLAFMGVPGIYFHSLFGSRSDRQGVEQTGRYRSINRQKLQAGTLLAELENPRSLRAQVYNRYVKLLDVRINEPAFHPLGTQTVLELSPQIFALERISPDGQYHVLALHNVSGQNVEVMLPSDKIWHELISGQQREGQHMTLSPYQVAWLK
jgi:sucrose phosphorylase